MARRRKTRDYLHGTLAADRTVHRVRIRVYEAEGEIPAIICSRLPGSFLSITNFCENLAAEVVLANFPGAVLKARKRGKFFCWIEHYSDLEVGPEPETFDLVEFSDYRIHSGRRNRRVRDAKKALEDARNPYARPRIIGHPRWQRVDKQTVKELVGMALDDTIDAPPDGVLQNHPPDMRAF